MDKLDLVPARPLTNEVKTVKKLTGNAGWSPRTSFESQDCKTSWEFPFEEEI